MVNYVCATSTRIHCACLDPPRVVGGRPNNQVSIGALYAADIVSALSASFLVSPLITIVDRSIMQNASGAMKMGDSVRY